MAFNQSQLTALEVAIASGLLTVEYSDRRVTYQSLSEMLTLRDRMKADVENAAGTREARSSVVSFARE